MERSRIDKFEKRKTFLKNGRDVERTSIKIEEIDNHIITLFGLLRNFDESEIDEPRLKKISMVLEIINVENTKVRTSASL